MHRTLVTIKDGSDDRAFILDILKVTSEQPNQYDLPLYYLGHIMQTSFEITKLDSPEVLGDDNGYQHLYKEASGRATGDQIKLNWLLNNRFYSYSAVTSVGDELILGRIGANDPEYNLRNDPTLIIRKRNTKNTVYASVLESHGSYNPVTELAVDAYSNVASIRVVYDTSEFVAVEIQMKNDKTSLFVIENNNNDPLADHQLRIDENEITWTGPFTYREIN